MKFVYNLHLILYLIQFKRRQISALTSNDSSLCLNAMLWSSKVVHSKEDSHTTKTDLHYYETFNTGNSESCLCSSIVYSGQFQINGFRSDSLYEKKIGEDLVFNNALPKSLTITQVGCLKAKPKLHNGMVYRQFIMIPVVLIDATNYVYKCIRT